MMSVCGVLCSNCPAYSAAAKGSEYQQQVVEAWNRIYGLNEIPEHISCGGCLGNDEDLFYTSRSCKARLCCRHKGLRSCAECSQENCPDLETAQAVWDEVPVLCKSLSASDFATYAQPYCGHRQRLAGLRSAMRKSLLN